MDQILELSFSTHNSIIQNMMLLIKNSNNKLLKLQYQLFQVRDLNKANKGQVYQVATVTIQINSTVVWWGRRELWMEGNWSVEDLIKNRDSTQYQSLNWQNHLKDNFSTWNQKLYKLIQKVILKNRKTVFNSKILQIMTH